MRTVDALRKFPEHKGVLDRAVILQLIQTGGPLSELLAEGLRCSTTVLRAEAFTPRCVVRITSQAPKPCTDQSLTKTTTKLARSLRARFAMLSSSPTNFLVP